MRTRPPPGPRSPGRPTCCSSSTPRLHGRRGPGTGKTRLDLTKAAALSALALLDDSAQVGVWSFSSASGGKDYRSWWRWPRWPEAKAATHRDASPRPSTRLRPGGNTGLYNTTWAACQEVAGRYEPGAANMVVLLTDGADDNNVAGGLTLAQC